MFTVGPLRSDVAVDPSSIGVHQGGEYLLDVLDTVRRIKLESVVYKHSGEVPHVDPPDSSVDVEFATEALLDRVVSSEATREKFVQFLHDGHEGVVAHDGEELVARGWIYRPESTSVPYNLPEWIADLDVYWLFHARTREPYRNQGWHNHLICRRLQRIYERDPDASVFTDATVDNVSRHTFASGEFDPCGTMTTYRLGHPDVTVKQLGAWNPDASHPPLPEVE